MYVKLFGTILDSSIWDESPATRIVWVTMLTMADENGFVSASPDGVARRANIPKAEAYAAIKTLEAPDIHSKSKEWGGRRIERMDGGWQVLNYKKYREIRTREQMKAADRQHRKRERDKAVTASDERDTSRDTAPEVEAEAKAEEEVVREAPTPAPAKPAHAHGFEHIAGRLNAEAQLALPDVLNRAPNRRAVLAEIGMILDGGRPGVPTDPASVSLAIVDLATNAEPPRAELLRAYVRRLANGGNNGNGNHGDAWAKAEQQLRDRGGK